MSDAIWVFIMAASGTWLCYRLFVAKTFLFWTWRDGPARVSDAWRPHDDEAPR